jgi:hypothetical protein
MIGVTLDEIMAKAFLDAVPQWQQSRRNLYANDAPTDDKQYWGYFASAAAALGIVVGFVANIDTIRRWFGGKPADISISQSLRSDALLGSEGGRNRRAAAEYTVVIDVVKYEATLTGCRVKLSWTDSEGGGSKRSEESLIPSGRQRYSVTIKVVESPQNEDEPMLAILSAPMASSLPLSKLNSQAYELRD